MKEKFIKIKENTLKGFLILIIVLILIDQLSKFIIIGKEEINIIPKVLTFKVNENVENSNTLYTIIDLLAIIVIYRYISSDNQFIKHKNKLFLSITLAGVITDLIDRMFRGYAVKFIDILNLPTLNLSYLYIVISWIAMAAILTKFTYDEIQKKKEKIK